MTDVLVTKQTVFIHRTKYSEDQPRDEQGRFTDGGSSGSDGGGGDAPQFLRSLQDGQSISVPKVAVGRLMSELRLAPAINLSKVAVNGEPNLFTKNLTGTPREQMPQLPTDTEGMKGYSDHLAANGITGSLEEVDPRSLTAMQNELNSAKVAGIYQAIAAGGGKLTGSGAGALIISQEGGILDGHHRWAATAAYAVDHPDTKMQVIRMNVQARELLQVTNAYSGIAHAGFAAGVKAGQPTSPPPSEGRWLWVDGQWVRVLSDADDDDDIIVKRK